MGKHQPDHQQADNAHGSAPATVGPRVAAARSRRKRTLIVASAAGLTLVVGGTAAAAVMVTGGDPQSGTSAVGVPEADPDSLVPDDAIPDQDGEAADRAQEAAAAAIENSSADGDGVAEEEEEETQEPEESTDSGGDGEGEPSGDGGACEASFYGEDFAGSTTANGETFDPNAMTAAHKTLPFDTMVEVTDPGSGDSVTVRINDRGPYIDGRCLDLSTAAFDQLVGTGSGVAQVEWQVVG